MDNQNGWLHNFLLHNKIQKLLVLDLLLIMIIKERIDLKKEIQQLHIQDLKYIALKKI